MAKAITKKNKKDIISEYKKEVLSKLKSEKRFNMSCFGIFHIKPSRKGAVHGFGKGTPPHDKVRVVFKASKDLKRFINQ